MKCLEKRGGGEPLPRSDERLDQRRPLSPGTRLNQRYSVERLLGGGAVSVTYAGMDEMFRRRIAIREYFPGKLALRLPDSPAVFPRETAQGRAFLTGADAFYGEADKLLLIAGSENVLDVRDRFFENGTAYMITDLYEGMSLKSYLRMSGRRLSDRELCYLLSSLSDGLLVVHSLSMLHGDIRPESIFLQAEGPAKLVDFGAAKAAALGGEADYSGRAMDPWTDIRALGETLFYARSGKRPPAAAEVTEADMAALPPAFRATFFSMLTSDRRKRFQNVFDLQHAANGIDIPKVRPVINRGLFERYAAALEERAKSKRRNLIAAAVFGGVALLLIGTLVYLVIRRICA